MNDIIIGSTALKYFYPEFKRIPNDIDIVSINDIKSSKKVEFHKNPILLEYVKEGELFLKPDLLLTLKVSHLFWDINWSKHMFDVQFLLQKGHKINLELFYRLYSYWTIYHSENKRSDLKMSKNEFFDNALKTYDHDYLHTLINENPVYLKVLKDGSEVEPDSDKFNNLSFNDKLELVREEVYVMGFERYYKLNYREAYSIMLKKFIISHAPIWEALFIIENYITLHKPKYDFISVLNNKVNE